MKTKTLSYIKLAVVFLLMIGLIVGLSFIKNENNTSSSNVQENYMPVQHLYLDEDNSTILSSNVSSRSSSKYTLRDFDLETERDFYIIIAFVNFSNSSTVWTQEDIDEVMLYFNDDNANNDIFSVYEYMYEQSNGKIRMRAGYVTDTTSYTQTEYESRSSTESSNLNYAFEAGVYNDALANGNVTIDGQAVTYFHCRILYFPVNSNGTGNSVWPHTWMGQGFYVTPKLLYNEDGPFVGTYCHELTHVLGLPDLYDYSYEADPVGAWYLMASTDYFYPQTINAYFKNYLGFIDESDIYDNTYTAIEEISSDGVYTLSPAYTNDGTIALKFGERSTTIYNSITRRTESATESFYIEYKEQSNDETKADYSLPNSGIIIYRVVESDTMMEYGNMYPSYTSCQYQVYVFRPSSFLIEGDSQNAAIEQNESYGSLSSYATNNIITYSNGTNSQVVVTNLGEDEQGNAQVRVEFANDLYSASGTLTSDGQKISGARIYIQTYNEQTQSYSALMSTNYYTDENGYFYIPNLPDNTRISFVKDGVTISTQVIVEGENLVGLNIVENTTQEVELNFFAYVNETEQVLANVNVYRDGTLLGTSDVEGNITLSLEIGDRLTFELEGYTFSTFTYQDNTQHNIRVQALVSLAESSTVQINVTTSSGEQVTDVEVYDITDSENIILITTQKRDPYFVFNAYVGMKVRVVSPNLSVNEFTVASEDFINTKNVVLYEYQDVQLKIVAYNSEGIVINISGMSVYVDGDLVGVTNSLGEINVTNVYNGQIITFEHTIYQLAPYTVVAGTTTANLTAEYGTVQVLLQFIRPQVEGDTTYDANNNLVPIDEIISSATIYVNNTAIRNAVAYDGKWMFEATFYSSLTFNSEAYAFTDMNGVILISNQEDSAHRYGEFIIDPVNADSLENGQITFTLYAKKYLSLSGQVVFPEDEKGDIVSIYVNDSTSAVATTNEDGTFNLSGIIEGDRITFVLDGYEFDPLYAINNEEMANLTIEAKPEDPLQYLGLYILFGVLALLFIIPFFIGLLPKKKYLESIDQMQQAQKAEETQKDSKKDKKNKKNKK